MKYPTQKHNKAFTLLELILTVMLTAIVIVTAFAAVGGLNRSSTAISVNDRQYGQAMFFFEMLSRDLANAVSDNSGRTAIKIVSGGTESSPTDKLVIYRDANPNDLTGGAAYAEVEYGMLAVEANENCLGRRLAPIDNLEVGNSSGRVFVLSEPIKSLKFECFDGTSWLRATAPEGTIAAMVRVTLESQYPLWGMEKATITRQIPIYPNIMYGSDGADPFEN